MPPTDAFAPPPGSDPLVGTVLGSMYKILRPLGEGGIGAVYVGQFVGSGQKVAIKLLRKEYTTHPEAVARFQREVSTMAGIIHENIARAYDCGETPNGESYMVLELVEGETLRDAVNRLGVLPLGTVMAVARQIGGALAHAHSLGVVHRDLKPENVVVVDIEGAYPRLKVLDFGMARVTNALLSGPSALTRVGSVFGTPAYMSPEQASARPVDPRSDQYSFGIMLYEMLAGRRPFMGDSPIAIIQMQLRQEAPPLAQIAPSVPPAVAAVVHRMLAKNPDERFADVHSAVEALVAAVRTSMPTPHVAGAAPPPGWSKMAMQSPAGVTAATTPTRAVWLVIAVFAVLLVAAVGILLLRG